MLNFVALYAKYTLLGSLNVKLSVLSRDGDIQCIVKQEKDIVRHMVFQKGLVGMKSSLFTCLQVIVDNRNYLYWMKLLDNLFKY